MLGFGHFLTHEFRQEQKQTQHLECSQVLRQVLSQELRHECAMTLRSLLKQAIKLEQKLGHGLLHDQVVEFDARKWAKDKITPELLKELKRELTKKQRRDLRKKPLCIVAQELLKKLYEEVFGEEERRRRAEVEQERLNIKEGRGWIK